MSKIVGIDLGTTNSVVSVLEGGSPAVIPTAEGGNIVPSVVGFKKDGERIVAYFGSIGVFCYDFAGKLLWSKDLGSFPMQMDWGTASSPVLHGDLVYIQCDNDKASFIVALNKNSGDEVWRMPRTERSNWATPFVWKNSQRTELVAGGGSSMRSYDLASGKLLWEMTASGRCSASPGGRR